MITTVVHKTGDVGLQDLTPLDVLVTALLTRSLSGLEHSRMRKNERIWWPSGPVLDVVGSDMVSRDRVTKDSQELAKL